MDGGAGVVRLAHHWASVIERISTKAYERPLIASRDSSAHDAGELPVGLRRETEQEHTLFDAEFGRDLVCEWALHD
jgi:hypothetical protein